MIKKNARMLRESEEIKELVIKETEALRDFLDKRKTSLSVAIIAFSHVIACIISCTEDPDLMYKDYIKSLKKMVLDIVEKEIEKEIEEEIEEE